MSTLRTSAFRTSALRKRSVRIFLRCVITAVTVGLITTGALAATSSHHSTYRTATVTRAAVNETLTQTGTIEPVSQATVAFPTSGTIAAVDVAVGDTVATGQTLAKLDTTSLQATLTSKESTLADAELTLHKALNGESSSPTSANGAGSGGGTSSAQQTTTSSTTTTATRSGASTGRSSGAANAKLTAARNAVTKAETAVRGALAAAQRALTAATRACNTTTTTTTSTTAPSTTSTTTVSTAPPPSCATAQAALLNSQQAVADAENTLAGAESRLASILSSTSGTASGSGSTSTQVNTPTSTPSNTTSGSTITADQLVADEANVAAARADVNAANETLAQATIVSPIAGAVAAVNLSVGTQASADSSTANVVIVGSGGYEVTTTITVADRPKVSVGDAATVTPDGSSTKLAGKVVSIGAATTSSSTSGSTTSYPVTVGFTDEPNGLRNGASSSVVIVVANTDSALTVPTSAVTTIGTTLHTVTLLANGKTSTVSVQIGTIGADRTAVTSGLSAGQTVVLADLGQTIPSSNATTRFGGGGGAFSGSGLTGGLGGGGFGRGG